MFSCHLGTNSEVALEMPDGAYRKIGLVYRGWVAVEQAQYWMCVLHLNFSFRYCADDPAQKLLRKVAFESGDQELKFRVRPVVGEGLEEYFYTTFLSYTKIECLNNNECINVEVSTPKTSKTHTWGLQATNETA